MSETEIGVFLGEIFNVRGRLTNDEIFVATIKEMKRLLTENYAYLDREELITILRNGVYGLYGEYFEVCAVTIRAWIDAYLVSHERTMYTLKNQAQRKALSATSTLTDHEKRQAAVSNIISSFIEYQKTNELIDLGNVKYRYLDEHGLLKYSPERKWEECSKAEIELKEEAKQKNKHSVYTISDWLKVKFTNNADIKSRAMLNLLRSYYDKIIAEKKQENFINALKKTI